jgi:hypothetical protein
VRRIAVTACVRQRLPNRRSHEAIEFEHNGFVYIGDVGRSREGRLAEVFLTAANIGTAAEAAARDAAILASLDLQHGVPAKLLRHALSRDGNGSPPTVIGKLLDLLAVDGGFDGLV